MEITTQIVELRTIKPTDGKYLTQANIKEGEERIFSTEVCLGSHDAPENWIEVDEEYKTAYEAEVKAKMNAGQ